MQQHMVVHTYYGILDKQSMAYAAAQDNWYIVHTYYAILDKQLDYGFTLTKNWIMDSLNRKKNISYAIW